ncbi:MAG: hypothetical protein Q7Q71_00840 [Verrucomicrobiota bacterium JB023]|nr:hypothetical protein [Verrucomicrobiota bacterium JB023]
MKVLYLVSCLILTSSFAPGQAAGGERKIEDVPAFKLAFDNLPEESRRAYFEHKLRAEQFFRQKRIFESLDEIFHASEIFKQDPALWNLKGSCHVEFRSFKKAREAFQKALALQPNNTGIMFNIAEMDFVTKNWEEAEKQFEAFAKKVEDDTRGGELEAGALELHRLAQFKRLLALLKLGREEEAKAIADEYTEFDNTPMTYYSKAAIHYHNGEEEEANGWLRSALRVFGGLQPLSNWQDTLIEVGYVKSFYGGEAETQDIELESE